MCFGILGLLTEYDRVIVDSAFPFRQEVCYYNTTLRYYFDI